jgi:hypothetical protein
LEKKFIEVSSFLSQYFHARAGQGELGEIIAVLIMLCK